MKPVCVYIPITANIYDTLAGIDYQIIHSGIGYTAYGEVQYFEISIADPASIALFMLRHSDDLLAEYTEVSVYRIG